MKIIRIHSCRNHNSKSLKDRLSTLLIFYSLIMPILTGMPGIPSVVKYVADVLWLSLILCVVINGRLEIRRSIMPFAVITVLFFVYVTVIYILRFQSIFYFLWGIRNLFRYYIAFFAFTSGIDDETVEKIFSFLEVIFWINFLVSIFQFVYMGIRQDYLGGVYGISGGTNGYTIALLCIVVARSLLINFERKGNMIRCFLTCIAALLIAAMAELKFYFVLFAFLLGFTAILTKFSFRKLLTMIIGFAGCIIGAQILVSWFGFDDFFSIRGIIEQATRTSYVHSATHDVNRLAAISKLNELVLNSPVDRIFGLGLGNCDTSSISIFNSTFYSQYRSLHYTWFTGAMVYLETGYLGLGLYCTFFAICFGLSYVKHRSGKGNMFNCRMTMIMSLVCCMLIFYNASLRYEAAYLIYFILALPFIHRSSEEKDQKQRAIHAYKHGGLQ